MSELLSQQVLLNESKSKIVIKLADLKMALEQVKISHQALQEKLETLESSKSQIFQMQQEKVTVQDEIVQQIILKTKDSSEMQQTSNEIFSIQQELVQIGTQNQEQQLLINQYQNNFSSLIGQQEQLTASLENTFNQIEQEEKKFNISPDNQINLQDEEVDVTGLFDGIEEILQNNNHHQKVQEEEFIDIFEIPIQEDFRECEICYENKFGLFTGCNLNHFYCIGCLKGSLLLEIKRGKDDKLRCPGLDCQGKITNDLIFERSLGLINFDQSQEFISICLVCKYMNVVQKNIEKEFKCQCCNTRYDRKQFIITERSQKEMDAQAEMRRNGLVECFKCTKWIEKSEGCDHMTCECSHEFCYQCGIDWTQNHPSKCQGVKIYQINGHLSKD